MSIEDTLFLFHARKQKTGNVQRPFWLGCVEGVQSIAFHTSFFVISNVLGLRCDASNVLEGSWSLSSFPPTRYGRINGVSSLLKNNFVHAVILLFRPSW